MSLMIIDRNRLQCSECDIRSSFTQFHPAGLWRDPASFERFCGLWLTGGNTCLTAAKSGSFSQCVSSLSPGLFPETDWLTGCLTDRTSVVEPCSPGTSPGHIWPRYTSLRVSAPHHSRRSGLQPAKPECDRNNCMRMDDILSQSNVSDPLTCRQSSLWTHKYHTSTWSMNAHARASIYAHKAQQSLPMLLTLDFKNYFQPISAQLVMLQK